MHSLLPHEGVGSGHFMSVFPVSLDVEMKPPEAWLCQLHVRTEQDAAWLEAVRSTGFPVSDASLTQFPSLSREGQRIIGLFSLSMCATCFYFINSFKRRAKLCF